MSDNDPSFKELGRELNEFIQEGIVPELDRGDDVEAEGSPYRHGPTVNVPLSSLLDADDDKLQATLQGDEGAMLRPSTAPPYSLPPRSEQANAQVRFAAQAQAALKNPQARVMLDPVQTATLNNILEAMKDLPAPDVTTWVENQRVVVAGEVISVPNKLQRKASLKLLRELLGGAEKCKGDVRGEKVIFCECPTHKVVRGAQQWGFRDKPMLWLSQQLAVELARDELWDKRPEDWAYNQRLDGEADAAAPRAIAALFSPNTAKSMSRMSRMFGISILNVFRTLVARICDRSKQLSTPTDYTDEFDV